MNSHRIVHVGYRGESGGAANAMQRIRTAVDELSASNNLIVVRASRESGSLPAFGIIKTLLLRSFLSRLLRLLSKFLYRGSGRIRSFGVLPSGIHKTINNFSADYIFLHWVGGEMMSFWDLRRMKGRIIIVFHDLWLINGTAHLSDDQDSDSTAFGRFISQALRRKKLQALRNLDVALVAPSVFVQRQIEGSREAPFNINVVGIPICPEVWRPMNKREARRFLGIHDCGKHLVFLCVQGGHDDNKGIHLMNEICSFLFKLQPNFQVVTFGANNLVPMAQTYPSLHVGPWHDDTGLRAVYSAADVLAIPSLFESFGQIAAEAQMVGRPVVAFKETGAEDVLEDGITGALVDPLDTSTFAEKIAGILAMGHQDYERLCDSARNHAIRKFSPKVVRNQYEDMFSDWERVRCEEGSETL